MSTDPQVLTCVYCGHQYPPGTPPSQHEALTAHIKVCKKHPMRAAELTIKRYEEALRQIVAWSHDKETLQGAITRLKFIASQAVAEVKNGHHLLL